MCVRVCVFIFIHFLSFWDWDLFQERADINSRHKNKISKQNKKDEKHEISDLKMFKRKGRTTIVCSSINLKGASWLTFKLLLRTKNIYFYLKSGGLFLSMLKKTINGRHGNTGHFKNILNKVAFWLSVSSLLLRSSLLSCMCVSILLSGGLGWWCAYNNHHN